MFCVFKVFEQNPKEDIPLIVDSLVIHIKKNLHDIDIYDPSMFDGNIYRITLSCYHLYDLETKTVFFSNFNDLIEQKLEIFLK